MLLRRRLLKIVSQKKTFELINFLQRSLLNLCNGTSTITQLILSDAFTRIDVFGCMVVVPHDTFQQLTGLLPAKMT